MLECASIVLEVVEAQHPDRRSGKGQASGDHRGLAQLVEVITSTAGKLRSSPAG